MHPKFFSSELIQLNTVKVQFHVVLSSLVITCKVFVGSRSDNSTVSINYSIV